MNDMKIVVVGGHMAPALGLINHLPKTAKVIYIGREHVFEGDKGLSLEQQIITQKDIRFIPLTTGRMQRSLTRQTLPSLLKIPKGFAHAVQILQEEKPDIVVAFGGYLSVPLGIAAKMLSIPLVIHEGTLEASLANKALSSFATKIFISFDSNSQYFPKKKTILTGMPLLPFASKNLEDMMPLSKEKLPLLLVVGGSGGSHAVNKLLEEILPEILKYYRVIHQTGDAREYGDYERLMKRHARLSPLLQKRYFLTKFINPEKINGLFAKSDLIIGRSGINTVIPLLILEKRALLIPLATGQKNEQYNNAKLLESVGNATILSQKELSGKKLLEEIRKTLSLKKHTPKWSIPVIKDGGERLAQEVVACILKNRQQEE